MARLSSLVGSALILALALCQQAPAAPVPDQQQLAVDSSRPFPVRPPPERQMFAQVVRAGMPGLLAEVRVPIGCYADSTLVLEIRAATTDSRFPPSVLVPGSSVLVSQTIRGATIPEPTAVTFQSLVLMNPPFIAADQSFAIVLFVPPSGNSCSMYSGPPGDLYPRGVGFFDSHPNQPGWVTNDSDLAFVTLVEPRCRVPNVFGVSLGEVAPLLARNGCVTGGIRREYSTAAPREAVVAQSTGEGTQLPSGSAVDLVVSLGSPCTVPRLLTKTLAQARSALARAHCRLGTIRTRPAPTGKRGRVVGQRPMPGTKLPGDGRVQLAVGRRAGR
jgi:hypothetical protein